MEKKRCLFCTEIVRIEEKGKHDHYLACNCAPGGFYSLLRDSYDEINRLSYRIKSKLFPIISAYIREQSDCSEAVTLAVEDLEAIENSPKIPVTIEEKEGRLLQYLYRHSEGPGDPVVIHPLTQSFNLTYSPNLQELVYIIEKLKEGQFIIREGMTFRLTEKGWSEAAATAGGRRLKSCFVLLTDDNDTRYEWSKGIFPKIEQCGYLPSLFHETEKEAREYYSIEQIAESRLIIADLTNRSPEVYLAAGYALGKGIPVIWTLKRNSADKLYVQSHSIRPIIYDTTEELAAMLQQSLSYKGTPA